MFYEYSISFVDNGSGGFDLSIDESFNGVSNVYQGQQAFDKISSLGLVVGDVSSLNLPAGFTPPDPVLVLDFSNFDPSLDVYEFLGSIIPVFGSSLLFDPDVENFHFYMNDLSFFCYSYDDIFVCKSPSVDYSSIVSQALTTSFVETSLNGSGGAKFKDGDIVSIQGFDGSFEVLKSQYIVNNENTGTIVYKVKNVDTGNIHYVPQVFLSLL